MILAYKYRLMPTRRQHAAMAAHLEGQRLLYNAAREHHLGRNPGMSHLSSEGGGHTPMSDDLIKRLRETIRLHTERARSGEAYDGFELRAFADEAMEATEALAAKDEALSEMRAELEQAQSEIKCLKTPDSYWEWNDPENGYSDVSEALCDAPMGGVVRLMTGKTLDDIWVTTRVLTVDENGDWDDHEIAIFDNPIDAEKCWSESLAAARALAPSIQDETDLGARG